MAISEEAVRLRAYQLWQNEGEPEGRALEHWQQAQSELGDTQGEVGLDYDAEGIENPGIGYSRGTTGEDIEAIQGENTLEGDVLNDLEPDGSIKPERRGRTNR